MKAFCQIEVTCTPDAAASPITPRFVRPSNGKIQLHCVRFLFLPIRDHHHISALGGHDQLLAARCSLGLMGVIIEVELSVRPVYQIEEHARRHASLQSVMECETEFPLQQFYLIPWSWDYFSHHRRESESGTSRLAWVYRMYRFLIVDLLLHIVVIGFARFIRFWWLMKFFYRAIMPLTVIRNWKVTDRSTNQLVMYHHWFRHIEIELFVRREQLPAAIEMLTEILQALDNADRPLSPAMRDQLEAAGLSPSLEQIRGAYTHHFPICIRRIMEDETLISMASGSGQETSNNPTQVDERKSDWFAISLIDYSRPSNRAGFLAFAKFIGPCFAELFAGRCHWGKYNPLSLSINSKLYPQLDSFRTIVNQFDPNGRFLNDWLSENLVGQTPD